MLKPDLSPSKEVLLDEEFFQHFKRETEDRQQLLTVRELTEEKIRNISQALDIFGYKNFDVVLSGSLVCGHYDKPKPRLHSLNGHCPDKFDSIIEADVRFIMPEDVQILQPDITKKLVLAASGVDTFVGRITRFNQQIDMVRTYDYAAINETTGLEFEICFNRQPYYEISRVWKQVFSEEEINWQKRVREVARHILHVDYETVYSELKALQTKECRYRICANYFLQGIQIVPNDMSPIKFDIPAWLKPTIDQWNKTNELTGTYRPTSLIPDVIVEGMKRHGLEELTLSPQEPSWVTLATKIKSSAK